MTRPGQPDSAAACADLIDRGVLPEVARALVMRLAGANNLLRFTYTVPVFMSLTGPSDDYSALARETLRWLRKHRYLPEPSRCRWCGCELNPNTPVVVQVDGLPCAKCAKERGVS